MPFPAVTCSVSMGIFGEYDNSCTGEGMPSPYNPKNLTDKSEFVRKGVDGCGMAKKLAEIFAFSIFSLAFRANIY